MLGKLRRTSVWLRYEPLPEDTSALLASEQILLVLDLRIPDLFQLVPLGDDDCGVAEEPGMRWYQ